jgi:hypothetical protein
MAHPSRDGLAWENHDIWGPKTKWTREPSIEIIEDVCRQELDLPNDAKCTVSFLTQGGFAKIFVVELDDNLPFPPAYIMRVVLPVDPHHKTRAEVTTMQWVRENTKIPVPEVISFDNSNDNKIGFEWILMEKMPGTPLCYQWRKLSMAQKTALVERIVDAQEQLRNASTRHNFTRIGTLVPRPEGAPTPGRLVDLAFFQADRVNYDVPRGPFTTSYGWLLAMLEAQSKHYRSAYDDIMAKYDNQTDDNDTEKANSDDETEGQQPEDGSEANCEAETVVSDGEASAEEQSDEEDDDDDDDDAATAWQCFCYTLRFIDLLPNFFGPAAQQEAEPTFMWHHDLNDRNILVDEQGSITAILDWECVSCRPFWTTTQFPQFLKGKPWLRDKPEREGYRPYETEFAQYDDPELDFEGMSAIYWEHLMAYERTQLRGVYTARMKQFHPDWDNKMKDSVPKVSFLNAALHVNNWTLQPSGTWLVEVDEGEMPDFEEFLWKPPGGS